MQDEVNEKIRIALYPMWEGYCESVKGSNEKTLLLRWNRRKQKLQGQKQPKQG